MGVEWASPYGGTLGLKQDSSTVVFSTKIFLKNPGNLKHRCFLSENNHFLFTKLVNMNININIIGIIGRARMYWTTGYQLIVQCTI